MQKKLVFWNIACTLLLQLVTLLSGFIVPKVILSYFGSGTNGLISSLNQFLNYITLLEGGIGGVVTASLYRPLAEGNQRKVSGILSATKLFFRRIALIYILYAVVLAVVYPRFVDTGYSAGYVFALTLVLAMNLFVQFFFALAFKLLLTADRKPYVVSISQTVMISLNIVAVIVAAMLFEDVLFIKFISALVFLVQPLLYVVYVKRHYQLDPHAPPDHDSLKQRWDGFGQNLAYFVTTNTDMIVLTIFLTLPEVSVYAVYAMVINAIKNLIVAISQAVSPSVGNVLVTSDNKKVNQVFDAYEFGMSYITTLLFTCCFVLLTPFVLVYTQDVTDAVYYRPVFGAVLAFSQMLYCYREPYVSVIFSAGHFSQTAKYAYIESALNLGLSILLVQRLGLLGVALGTVAAMLYRMFTQVWYLKTNILYRPVKKFFARWLPMMGVSAAAAAVCYWVLPHQVNGYLGWFLCGAATFVISTVIITGASAVLYSKDIRYILGGKLHKRG